MVKTLEADVLRLQFEANTAGRQADKAVAKLHALPKVPTIHKALNYAGLQRA